MQNLKRKMQNFNSKAKSERNFDNFEFLIAILSFNFLIFSFMSGCQPRQDRPKMNNIIPVRVSVVRLETLNETIDYVGDIKAQDEAVVYPKVSGKIIEKIKADGNPVSKKEAIAYIDRDEVGLKFERAPVESPLSGLVGRVYVDIGQNVTPQTPVALVVSMEKVRINLDIPEKYLHKISIGQQAKITVDAFPQETFSGLVVKISPVVDLTTRAAPVEIIADNKDYRLRPGMFAKVNLIIQEHKDVPVLLKEAVMGREPNFYVYTIKDKKAVLKKIALGIRQGPYYEVKGGLGEGDVVVIMGQQRLYEGAQVSVEEEKE